MEGTRVIPDSISENTLWTCAISHYLAADFSFVKQGSTALLVKIDRVPGNVHFIVAGKPCTIDWDSFTRFYVPGTLGQSANHLGHVV